MRQVFFTFNGRAKNLLPAIENRIDINIPKVHKPDDVSTCHDQNHFINVLLDGQCSTCKGRGYFSIKSV